MYCLAKAEYEYYVYGVSSKVKVSIEGNLQNNWKLQFYSNENDLLHAVKSINKVQSQDIVNLID